MSEHALLQYFATNISIWLGAILMGGTSSQAKRKVAKSLQAAVSRPPTL